uniref:Glycosyltransferase 2-like domain-containing protein n=2 Tax=Araucaria cunninghamii TaxID=56994 RepID=A0A0D6QSQ6_ARACU
MESRDSPLYTTIEKPLANFNRAYACIYSAAILGLVRYRIVHMPSEGSLPWILVFLAEIGFAFLWILDQAFRWRPVERHTFPERLSKRFENELPPVDIFICTADPTKEPPLTVVNTALSTLAFDYPVEKLACYVSDDGGSPFTFYALLEASCFAKFWVPFCHKYSIEQRCPDEYFSNSSYTQENKDSTFAIEWESLKDMYEEMKYQINSTVERGAVPEDKYKKHEGFKEWSSGFTAREHPSIIQILLEKGKDTDVEGHGLPNLVYVSREKRAEHPHNFKAGALNVLIRVSSVISNAPFILTLDCDMYANNCQALREAMCFFMDSVSGHKFGFVQFPQRFHGITKNDLYSNQLKRIFDSHYKGLNGNYGPPYVGTGCVHRRDVLCGSEPQQNSSNFIKTSIHSALTKEKGIPSKMVDEAKILSECSYEENSLWGKKVGMLYGCAVEDILTGFSIHCKGWKSAYCLPKRNAFQGVAPVNLNDSLVQHKRWSAGWFEIFVSKYCPFRCGIPRVGIAQKMAYSFYCLWAPSSLHIICYGLVPALSMLSGQSLFPKISDPWFLVFAFLSVCAYTYSVFELIVAGGSLRSWWNEQRMWMIRSVSSYLFGLIQVACKLTGLSKVGFEVTSKVSDSEAAKRYKAEVFEFGVASSMFVPPACLAMINLIALLGGIVQVLRTGYPAVESMFMQLMLSSLIVATSYPILEGMFVRKDKGRMPTSITVFSVMAAAFVCTVASNIYLS